LQKMGAIEHFNFKNSIFTLSRRSNGDCQNLDAKTRRCNVYDKRPNTCRLHPQVGPRPGYCPCAEEVLIKHYPRARRCRASGFLNSI
jgi:Fe-S-cluster containining protein